MPLRLTAIFLSLIALATVLPLDLACADTCASQISAYRRAHGLSAVRADSRLDGLARRQAEAMARTGAVSHTADGDFRRRVSRVRPRLAGENLAAGSMTCAEAIKQWDNSSGHRANLRMDGARRVGVASVAKPSSPYRMFWAMIITD